MASETWCIVHAHGVMRAEVSQTVATGHLAALSEWHGWRAVRLDAGESAIAASEAMGDSAEEACARLAVGNGLAVREILAPGEPTRAELREQVAAVTAERDASRAEAATGAAMQALDAIAAACGCPEWEYPGQVVRDVTTALATMTRAVDALRAAAVAAGHPAADGDPDAQLCAVRAAAWSAGAEAMRERCAARCDELAEQESELSRATEARGDQYNAAIRRDRAIARLQAAAEIRTLPVPPCPWGVCCGTAEVSR